MNKDLLDEITDIEMLKVYCRQLNKLVMIKENKLDQQQQEIERLNNIIKEVREYILNTKMFTYGEEKEFFLKDYWYGKELLEILDKGSE